MSLCSSVIVVLLLVCVLMVESFFCLNVQGFALCWVVYSLYRIVLILLTYF